LAVMDAITGLELETLARMAAEHVAGQDAAGE
jgi:hypothetical protein